MLICVGKHGRCLFGRLFKTTLFYSPNARQLHFSKVTPARCLRSPVILHQGPGTTCFHSNRLLCWWFKFPRNCSNELLLTDSPQKSQIRLLFVSFLLMTRCGWAWLLWWHHRLFINNCYLSKTTLPGYISRICPRRRTDGFLLCTHNKYLLFISLNKLVQ